LKQKAVAFAAGQADKVHILTDSKIFFNHLQSRLLPSARHLFLVESPTSRPRILSDYLEVVSKTTEKMTRLMSFFFGCGAAENCVKKKID